MYIKNKYNNSIYGVYGTKSYIQEMRDWHDNYTVNMFLIFKIGEWTWVDAKDYEPFEE